MKKLIIIFLLLTQTLFAIEMPYHLRGYWVYNIFKLNRSDWVTRTSNKILLRAYSDRVEIESEIWYIDKVEVIEDNSIRKYTTITFKNQKEINMLILHMKEANELSVTLLKKNRDYKGLYYFRPVKKVSNE